MSTVPAGLYYTENHEWLKDNGDGTVTVGITDHAQQTLGDVVFVELPEIGKVVTQGDEFALLESVKAASDVYSPISGEITKINDALETTADLVNQAPYEAGWIAVIRLSNPEELQALLDSEGYMEFADAQ